MAPMASFLRRKFGDRLNLVLGDSRLTVPRYFRSAAVASCDLTLVDGGHGFDVALSDIRHLARVASRPHNLIIVDDINNRRVRTAWKVAMRAGIVHPVFTCSFGSNGRAFALGVVGRQKNFFRRSISETSKDWT